MLRFALLPLRLAARACRRPAVLLAALTVMVACGSSPAPPPQEPPRETGASTRAYVGEAELQLRYRYEPKGGRRMEFFVDASASGGAVGEITIEVRLDGFEAVGGPLSWTLSVPDGQTETRSVMLVAVADTPSLTVTTKRVEGATQLASDSLGYIVDAKEDAVRECRPTDEACPKQ